LDYETVSSYSLTIEVTDDGTPSLNSSATVTITINDVVEGVATPVTGIEEMQFSSQVSVYPNPSRGQVSVFISETNEIAQVKVYDLAGQLMKEKILSEGSIDLSSLNSGVYMMEIISGEKRAMKRLVIED
jgi:hypothetical protein